MITRHTAATAAGAGAGAAATALPPAAGAAAPPPRPCRIWMLSTLVMGRRHMGQVRVRLSSSLAHSSHMQKWRHGRTVVFLRLLRQTTQ